jgi:hypothetical protein
MGHRAWLTKVESPGEWDFLRNAIRINPLASGVSYIIDVTEEIPKLSRGICAPSLNLAASFRIMGGGLGLLGWV